MEIIRMKILLNDTSIFLLGTSVVCLWFLVVATAGGCSAGDSSPRQSLQGQVTLDQKPVSDAVLVLTPIDSKGLVAVAEIHHGSFSFGTKDGPGPGNYFVRINPNEPEMGESGPEALKSNPGKTRSIPQAYQSNGKLQIAIKSSPNPPLLIELVSPK